MPRRIQVELSSILHGRLTQRIRLSPFTLAETRPLLENQDVELPPQQLVSLHMGVGGVAKRAYPTPVRCGRADTTSQMGSTPQDLTASADQVAAHMVKSRSATPDAGRSVIGRQILGQ
jgi:hypothetical protein